MDKLVLATNNLHKKAEVQEILKDIKILNLKDINFFENIVEDGVTFEENALIKARTVFNKTKIPTIADDSGLCVEKLNNEPGVFSARYSKEGTDNANLNKVLLKLNGETSKAKYVSVIAYIDKNGKEFIFSGEVLGEIISSVRGENGFGYDPIFYYEPLKKTFAELTSEEKNSISHRKVALEKFLSYLKESKKVEN